MDGKQLFITLGIVLVCAVGCEGLRVRRDMKLSRTEAFTVIEGETLKLNCSKTNGENPAGGVPYMIVVPKTGSASTPTLTTSRPTTYTVQSEFEVDRDYNDYYIRCQNDTDTGAEKVWDRKFVFTVYYMDLVSGKQLTGNTRSVPEGGRLGVDCRDWFSANWNIEYHWTGEVVRDSQRDQSYVNFLGDGKYSGTKQVSCTAKLAGDSTGVSQQTVQFSIEFPPNPNNASTLRGGNGLLLLAVFLVTLIAGYLW